MRSLRIIVALACSLPLVTAASGAKSYPPSVFGISPNDCRTHTYAELVAWAIIASPNRTDYEAVTGEVSFYCFGVCTLGTGGPRQVDALTTCSDHSYHAFYPTFNGKLTKRNALMWPIFFLIMSVLIGALLTRFFPAWLPYTVGLLLLGVIFGGLAQALASNESCPMYAMIFDMDGNDKIDRDEWDLFTCADCTVDSFCAAFHSYDTTQLGADVNTAIVAWYQTNFGIDVSSSTTAPVPSSPSPVLLYPLTCKNTGCIYSWDKLDKPFKVSAMLAESIYFFPHGGGHRRRSLAESSEAHGSSPAPPPGEGDGYLQPDELWRPGCNLLRDMLSLMDIDPHLMLVVFLPALLFESACFGIDMGIFRKQLSQILIMAFPCMILASFITALCLHALAPPSWTLWVSWLIGIIASATDPVAVVALLKELGAAKTLGTLIEGESLLNDGSAVVLFTWVRNCIGYDYATLPGSWMYGEGHGEPWPEGYGVRPEPFGAQYTAQIGSEFLRVVVQMAIFGGILGVAFGWITVKILQRLYNSRVVEVSIVVTLTYLVFWLGELVMGSSAVLAVVVMGLYVNSNRSSISPSVLHFLHEFYEMVAFFLNTVIFLIAGCKLGALMADQSFWDLYTMGQGSLSMIVLIYPIILFARGAAIAIAFPLLKRLGTGCTWQEAIVMWWGGLRGSVGLALALAVHHTLYDEAMWGDGYSYQWGGITSFFPTLNCRDQPLLVLTLILYVVLLTVVINGVTMAPLMKVLKLTDVPEERQFMLKRAKAKLDKGTAKALKKLHEQYGDELRSVDWKSPDVAAGSPLTQCSNCSCTAIKDVDRCTWLLVLSLERAFYLAQFEAGSLGDKAFRALEGSMADTQAAATGVETAKLGVVYDEHFVLLLKTLQSIHPAHAFEAGLAYISAQHEVEHLTEHDSAEDGSLKDARKLVKEEHADNVTKMKELLKELREKSPAPVDRFQKRFISTQLLRKQKELVEHMKHEGEILDLDAAPLIDEIDKVLEQRLLGKKAIGGGALVAVTVDGGNALRGSVVASANVTVSAAAQAAAKAAAASGSETLEKEVTKIRTAVAAPAPEPAPLAEVSKEDTMDHV